MSNITVYLSTTKFTVATDHPHAYFFIKKDLPVCCASMCIASFGFSPHELEINEHYWAETQKDMAKFVIIDSNKKTVYIGDDACGKLNGLIEYTESIGQEYQKHFFERWDQTHVVLFEFTIFDKNSKPISCLKGLWEKDHWLNLEVTHSNNIQIISSK